jgi:hypothetical protein
MMPENPPVFPGNFDASALSSAEPVRDAESVRATGEQLASDNENLFGAPGKYVSQIFRSIDWANPDQPKPPQQTCEHCVFWKSEGYQGQCRVNPPAPVWPVTLALDWCGKFQARSANAPQPAAQPDPSNEAERSVNA